MKAGDDRARRALEVYEAQIRHQVEPGHIVRIVAFDLDSGEFFLGDAVREACQAGRRKHAGKVFFSLRVGAHATFHVGGTSGWRA